MDEPEFAGFCACGGVFVKIKGKAFHYVCNNNPNHTLVRIGLPLTPIHHPKEETGHEGG